VSYLREWSNARCDEWEVVMVKGLVGAQEKALGEEETENDGRKT
jgi:hypothetical protein